MFFKTDYKAEILKCLEKGNSQKIIELFEKVHKDKNSSEDLLAWIAAIIYEKEIGPAINIIPEFVNRFTNSLHGIRIYYSQLLSR